jgi:hypothetical protein
MSDTRQTGRGGKRGAVVGSFERQNQHMDQEVPVALEQVLLLAAQDEAFKGELLADVSAALDGRGLSLRQSEAATLRAMPRSVLEATIGRLDPSKQRNTRFVKAVTTAAVAGTMVLSSSMLACCGGIAPDWDSGPDADQADADQGDADQVDADGADADADEAQGSGNPDAGK